MVCHTEGTTQLKVFKNRLLEVICKPKREDITEGWRKFYNEEHMLIYQSIIESALL
jgi:hypothetical protein